VHLESWPDAAALPDDPDLVSRMDLVREVCSAAHSIRKANGLRARLPLASLVVAGPGMDALEQFAELIADEVNVRSVHFVDDASRYASASLTVVFKVAAPRLGPATQDAAKAARAGDWELLTGADEGRARCGASALEPGEFEMKVTPADERTTRPLPGRSGVVVLDIDVPPELEVEGRARDFVRELQKARRDAGLEVTDRITVEVAGGDAIAAMLQAHGALVEEQVLAVALTFAGPDPVGPASGAEGTGGETGWVRVELADATPVAFRISRAG
jgi:isoleucyl-tRNA synthetase